MLKSGGDNSIPAGFCTNSNSNDFFEEVSKVNG